MTNFGTLEFVLDRYAKCWCWKISGTRAVNMVSKLIPRGWYGDKPDEVIVSDNDENIKKLKMINDRYPFEILSKSIWKRKIIPLTIKNNVLLRLKNYHRQFLVSNSVENYLIFKEKDLIF